MIRDDVKAFIGAGIFTLFLLCATFALADEPKLPPGYTCQDVRNSVAQYGRLAAYAWAKINGYSRTEIAAARRCLK